MLIKLRFRFPDIFLGMMLAVAIFAMGATFWSSENISRVTEEQSKPKANDPASNHIERKYWWQDATADFTFGLIVVGLFQAGIFYVQLRFLRKSLRATVTIESPIAVIPEMKIVPYSGWGERDGLVDRLAPGPIPDFCRVLISVINLGKSSMQITSFCIEREVLAELPLAPNYRTIDRAWNPWLGFYPHQPPLWFRANDHLTELRFSDAQRQSIQAGTATLWIYGYFTYLNALEEELTHKFMARWDLQQGLVGEQRPGYI
jgi:hypothetical protein